MFVKSGCDIRFVHTVIKHDKNIICRANELDNRGGVRIARPARRRSRIHAEKCGFPHTAHRTPHRCILSSDIDTTRVSLWINYLLTLHKINTSLLQIITEDFIVFLCTTT